MTKGGVFPPSDMGSAEMVQRLRDGLSPRDHAMHRLRHTLLDQQLDAIKELIHRHQQAEAATWIKFEELDTEVEANPDDGQLDVIRDQKFWKAVFMESAHSMSAVGMLAPFIESLFIAIFDGLRKRDRSKGLVAGIDQLAKSSGLEPYLPDDYQTVLKALFAYRNNMFHNGFEWPPEAIEKFTERIASEGWPESWFTSTDRGEKPWLFYMTPEFCAHCVAMTDDIIEGAGQYWKERGS